MELNINQQVKEIKKKDLLNTINNLKIYNVEKFQDTDQLIFVIQGIIKKPFELYYEMLSDKEYVLRRLKRFSDTVISESPIIINRHYLLNTEYFNIKKYIFSEKWKIVVKNQDEIIIYAEIIDLDNQDKQANIITKGYKKIIIKNDKQDTYLSAIINYNIKCNEFLKSLFVSECIEILRKIIKF
jgi:hypothetical protein